jgi:arylsulfatase A
MIAYVKYISLIIGALFIIESYKVQNETKKEQLPNILLVLADDMGYGDAKCFNSESKINTPNIDRLARGGMRFTNAHAPGTTCTPSRYGLLTGQYPFRNTRNYKEGLIKPGTLTIASLLKRSGYKTAVIGKWHQGMINEKNPQPGVDLIGNPGQHGFDYHFIMPASLDIPPYYYVENGQCVFPPSDTIGKNNTPGISPIQGAFWRAGGIAPGYKLENVVDELTTKATNYIESHFKNNDQPLFLYLPLPSPHTPWLPNSAFKGSTSVGDYGDYTSQTDGALGTVLDKLEELGRLKNTLVIFSSDNGPVWYHEDVEKYGHSSTGKLRGMKGDAWEGGHRMPFVVQWPGKIEPNTINEHLTCFTDLMATFAEISEQELPNNTGEDCYSLLQQLTSKKSDLPQRENLVLKGGKKDSYFIIAGDWKYLDCSGPGGFSEWYLRDKGVEFNIPKQLYNLSKDIGEKNNLFLKNKEKADELATLLYKIREGE